ncbi:hypothetical protein BGX33_006905 [Mortierella sp. NVP41]|nr:hypothetical protein BGX33_006905 [Mortierella sp. NVP41]
MTSLRMLAHNNPQVSTTSELATRPYSEHRQGTGQLAQQPLAQQPHPRQERAKRKISHREPKRTTADPQLPRAHVDHLATPTGLSHQSRRVDSQEPMTADPRTQLNGAFLQRPPSFEPFGVHRQELLSRAGSSAETGSHARVTDNTSSIGHDIGRGHNGNDTSDSHQFQHNPGRPARTDYRSKRNLAGAGVPNKGENLDGRSTAQDASRTSLFGQDTAEQHRDIHSNLHLQHSTGQPMTIRDILDSQELRNQLTELHRSLNSNPDPHLPRYISSAQAQSRPSNQPTTQYPRSSSSVAQADRPGPRRGLRDESVANDLTMDTSLLESRFRARLDADIQVLEAPQEHQHTTENGRATASSNIHESDYRKLLPTERQRRELYHSSYSPSEYSPAEENEEEEVDDDEDDEEEQNTVELKPSSLPSITQTPPLPQPQQQGPSNLRDSLTHHRTEPSERRNNGRLGPGYESDEISFEREIARARAKRELGASQNNGSGRPDGTRAPVSKLDHGRDLALEDLASPVRYDFEDTQEHRHPLGLREQPARTIAQGHPRRADAGYPIMTADEELARLNMFTKAEDRFMELAGSLGEGQAVSSVLDTLKGMIRQAKTEKRLHMAAAKMHKKNLKQAERELRRMRKANEKLSRKYTAALTRGSGSRHGKDKSPDLENATFRPRRGLSLEEQEQERKNAAIQREKDRADREVKALQEQLDALKVQKEAVQKRERLRAEEEEADLLFLIESDGGEEDDEDDEDEDEDDSESDSDSEEEDSYRIQDGSVASGRSDRDTPLFDARARRNSSAKKRSSSKGASVAKGKEVQRNRTGVDTHRARDRSRPVAAQSKSSRSKSAHPNTRHLVDKVEEVHIHHHVYYGDADMDEMPSTRPRTINGAQPRFHHSVSRLDDRVGGHDEAHRLNIGSGHRTNDAGFNSYRHGSSHQGLLEKSMLSRSFPGQRMYASQRFEAPAEEVSLSRSQQRRHQPGPHAVNWEEQQGLGNPIPAPKDAEAYPLYRTGPNVNSTAQGSGRMVTRVHHGFGVRGAGAHEITIPLKNQKKISIDLNRVRSLLKTRDPRLCIVCRNGGGGRDHATHYRDDHQQQPSQRPSIKIDGKPVLVRHKSSAAARSTIQPSSSSRADGPNSGKVNSAYRDAMSDSESSVLSASDSEARRTARDDSRGRGVGGSSYPTRRRSQSQPPQTTETDIGDNNEEEDNHPPEWKLHVTLCKLDKEVQHLRKSHLDLSRKLERLGSSSSLAVPTTTAADETEEKLDVSQETLDRKRQQRSQLRQQLQRVVDSLEEKAEEILRLQHCLLEQQERQQESHEQTESVDVSDSSRLKRRGTRKPTTVEDVQDQDDFDSSQKETESERWLSSGKGPKFPERYKHRPVHGSRES